MKLGTGSKQRRSNWRYKMLKGKLSAYTQSRKILQIASLNSGINPVLSSVLSWYELCYIGADIDQKFSCFLVCIFVGCCFFKIWRERTCLWISSSIFSCCEKREGSKLLGPQIWSNEIKDRCRPEEDTSLHTRMTFSFSMSEVKITQWTMRKERKKPSRQRG